VIILYGDAVIEAAAETGLAELVLPPTCRWPFEQLLDPTFRPDPADS
jgi:hypothetical protein